MTSRVLSELPAEMAFNPTVDGLFLLKLGLPLVAVFLSFWWNRSAAAKGTRRRASLSSASPSPSCSSSVSRPAGASRSQRSSLPLPRSYVMTVKGRRSCMEDAHLEIMNLLSVYPSVPPPSADTALSLFAVFDGHGGAGAAEYARAQLPLILTRATPQELLADPEKLLNATIQELESKFLAVASERKIEDGASLVVAVIANQQLVVSNLGSCHAVVCRAGQAAVLSTDHTLDNWDERARVTESGGVIYKNRLGHPHLNHVLFNVEVTRALGDRMYKDLEITTGKESGLLAVPDSQVWSLGDLDEFVILFTGSLCRRVNFQNLCATVKSQLESQTPPSIILHNLLGQIIRKSHDNVTAMLILLKPF